MVREGQPSGDAPELRVMRRQACEDLGKECSEQFCCCSVAKSCLTLCNPIDCSTPASYVLH